MPLPGQTTPGPRTPGDPTPGDEDVGVEVVTVEGVAIDATGSTTVGTPDGFRGRVTQVVVTPTAADFDFNIEQDGSDVFAAEQSPSGASREVFTPDQNDEFEGDAPDLDVDVSSASGSGGATATVTVHVEIEEA